MGVLSLAKFERKIETIKPFIDMLIENNYRISNQLYEQVLKNENEW
nr:DUF3368 domain-containing protein [Gracilibacillus kekensis]